MRKLLIIDDSNEFASMLAFYSSESGFEAEIANSGADGLAKARASLPQAIVLDFVIGDMTGAQVLESLRRDKITADIPVLVVSSIEGDKATCDSLKSQKNCFGIVNKTRTVPEIFGQVELMLKKHAEAGGGASPKG